MSDPAGDYLFHVHALVPAWRLVLLRGASAPRGAILADWRFTLARAAEDTNPDVRRLADEQGFCLFKIGGDFSNVAADVRRKGA
jgi:hypothetical protein